MAAPNTTSKNKKWQKEEEELLWKLYKENHPFCEIATTLKRTVGAIKARKDMLSIRGCPVPGCIKLFANERGRNMHCLKMSDDAHKALRDQKAKSKFNDSVNSDSNSNPNYSLNSNPTPVPMDTDHDGDGDGVNNQQRKPVIDSSSPMRMHMPPVDSLESTVEDSLESTLKTAPPVIMEYHEDDDEDEDEKKDSESAEGGNRGNRRMARHRESEWNHKVFTQMEVTVKKSSKVWVHEESWNGNQRKVQFKYDDNGKIYQGMRWKFSGMDEPTGMEALDALAMKVISLEETVRGLRRQLDAKDNELQRIVNEQNEGLTAMMGKLNINKDGGRK